MNHTNIIVNQLMKIHLCFYTNERFRPRETYLIKYYKDKGFNVFPYRSELVKIDDFYNENKKILDSPTGDGYWLWKPYLIMKTLNQMKENDILLYLDIGCEIDIRKKDKILELIEKVKEDLIIGSFTHNDKDWSKFDLVDRLQITNPILLLKPQHQASCIMIKKCQKTIDLVKEWYEISYENNYHYIDDSKSIKKNLIGFREHRHDQSIFSLLTKKYNIYSKITIEYGINIARNRSGKSDITGKFINPDDKKILGIHILGEGASELIHIGQAVMAHEGTIDYFVNAVFNDDCEDVNEFNEPVLVSTLLILVTCVLNSVSLTNLCSEPN